MSFELEAVGQNGLVWHLLEVARLMAAHFTAYNGRVIARESYDKTSKGARQGSLPLLVFS